MLAWALPARPGTLPSFLAPDQVVGAQVGEHRHLGVEQGHVDMLAFAGALGVAQGGLDGDRGVEPGEEIGHGDADLLRATAGQVVAFAGDAHQAAHALDGVVVARALPVGAGLAEAGDGAIHQARVDGAQAFIVQPVSGHVADLEVFDEHMGVLHQFADQSLAFWLGNVAGDGALVAVGAQVVGGFCGVGAVAPAQEGRAPAACVVASGVVPLAGRSTLTTSAPRSASVCVHQGPASTRDKSSMRIPSRAFMPPLSPTPPVGWVAHADHFLRGVHFVGSSEADQGRLVWGVVGAHGCVGLQPDVQLA